jgi:hypothetical protein
MDISYEVGKLSMNFQLFIKKHWRKNQLALQRILYYIHRSNGNRLLEDSHSITKQNSMPCRSLYKTDLQLISSQGWTF